MSEQLNLMAAHAFFDAWNAGDLNKAEIYEADDYMAERPGPAGPMSRMQTRAYDQNFLTAFPGSQFEIWLTVSQGDYVVSHWKISGTHSGPLQTPSGMTIPASGKHVTLSGTITSEIKNGKIARQWAYFDMASLLGQLGLLPPM